MNCKLSSSQRFYLILQENISMLQSADEFVWQESAQNIWLLEKDWSHTPKDNKISLGQKQIVLKCTYKLFL